MAAGIESSPGAGQGPAEADTFLSRDFHELAGRKADSGEKAESQASDFDLVIVGSGYGAAMAATVFAGCTLVDPVTGGRRPARIAMLERGTERLPGAFPDRFADLPGDIRIQGEGAPLHRGIGTGLFDLRPGSDLASLVANGLGGGSLINAGVMLEPLPEVFDQLRWPKALRTFPADLQQAYRDARCLLGAAEPLDGTQAAGSPSLLRDNTISVAERSPAQFQALKTLARPLGQAVPVPVTVQLDDRTDHHPVRTSRCIQCGDCATGCNHNAKRSLDVTALPLATRQPGFEIFTGATVLRFDPVQSGGWVVHVVPTGQAQRARLNRPLRLRCAKLVLAAGTFGSTALMLRSQRARPTLGFSPRLGRDVSGNGDLIAAITDLALEARSVGQDGVAAANRNVGPTISGMVDLRQGRGGAVIQALAIPHPLRRVLAETLGFVRVMGAIDAPQSAGRSASASICTVDEDCLKRSMIFAVMGDDRGRGLATLNDRPEIEPGQGLAVQGQDEQDRHPCDVDAGDGTVSIRWLRGRRPDPSYSAAWLAQLALMAKAGGPEARAYADPLSRPLGGAASDLTGSATGPSLTVHPLGGCPMGASWRRGVVDHLGRVFRRAGPGEAAMPDSDLIILDGSIVPVALGINPALTIAALALRASRQLVDDWGWQERASSAEAGHVAVVERPRARTVSPRTVSPVPPTRLELIERQEGPAAVEIDGRRIDVHVELTLRSAPFGALAPDGSAASRIELSADARPDAVWPRVPDGSFVRIYRRDRWAAAFDAKAVLADHEAAQGRPGQLAAWLEQRRRAADSPEAFRDEIAWLKLPVSGHIELLHEESASGLPRAWHGWWAWLRSTGLRSGWQAAGQWLIGAPTAEPRPPGRPFRDRLAALHRMLSHAGRSHAMRYELRVHASSSSDDALERAMAADPVLIGRKRLRYERAGNPWRQLMQIRLLSAAALRPARPDGTAVTLALAPGYLAWTRTPLLAVVDEDNHVDGLADLAAFLLQTGRVVLLTQFPAFVRPDEPRRPPPAFPAPGDDGFTMSASDRSRLAELAGDERHRLPRYLPGLAGTRHLVEIAYRSTEASSAIAEEAAPAALLTRYRCLEPTAKVKAWAKKLRRVEAGKGGVDGAEAGPPVLLVHGYSASGTTFAHPALKPSLAEALARQGRDVWVLDLRSSCGLRSADLPWTFEDLAFGDIPCAIATVLDLTAAPQVDVVAHCMGAAMVSMALLGAETSAFAEAPQPRLGKRIRRLVLSQSGPVMRFNGGNLFRAYAMQLLRHALPRGEYQLRPRPDSLADQLLDRLLTTLPYPDAGDFATETATCRRTPWTAIRHRMDAVFGRVFRADRMPQEVLAALDDFFGPFSLRTIGQSLWFARHDMITSAYGDLGLPGQARFIGAWPRQTLAIHAAGNGIFDPFTLVLLRRVFDSYGIGDRLTTKLIPEIGHQDGFIGDRRSVQPLQHAILEFLEQGLPVPADLGQGEGRHE